MASVPPIMTLRQQVSLKPYTTLKAGGRAELFAPALSRNELIELALAAQARQLHTTVLGNGSNVLPSDDGVHGLVVVNLASEIQIDSSGQVIADCGCSFQDLFLRCAQRGLGGLEFAVGIPGSLGGALVSNAGAYRSNISEFLTEIQVVTEGESRWVQPDFLQFAYRDSRLRQHPEEQCVLVSVKMSLPSRERKAIYEEARDYQRQRITKQPAPASAGSFFKNVNDPAVADRLPGLPRKLKDAGVVPAGYLIEQTGLIGYRLEGAMFSRKHANFIINIGNADASAIRRLASLGKKAVFERFGVTLEEEVLYLGDWSRWERVHSKGE